MGKKDKLRKFAEISDFPNVYQNFNFQNPDVQYLNKSIEVKGKWKSDVFQNNNSVVLELACGRGEYSIGLSKIFPNKNFIGIDCKGNRIWNGAKTAIAEDINQVKFLRTRIELLPVYFEAGEVDEIWIIFPDPQLKDSREKHRLTSPLFLDRYKQILKPNAFINLKTDSPQLYEYTLEIIEQEKLTLHQNIADVYAQKEVSEELQIKTYYEGKHLEDNRTIRYLQFSL